MSAEGDPSNMPLGDDAASLRLEVARLRAELAEAKRQISRRNTDDMRMDDVPVAAASSTSEDLPAVFGVANLSAGEVERYSRQMLLDDLGPHGTKRLREARVLVVGAGGLGSTIALYLAAAGVGNLTIVDFDVVERSNLHRQVMHRDDRIDMPKAVSAKLSCEALNPDCKVEPVLERFDVHNAQALCKRCDVVVDASDNVASRYLVNDAAVLEGKPLVSGSAMRWDGQMSVYHSGPDSPCYRCVFPRPPTVEANCNDTGVCGPVPGLIGCLQAVEAIKVLAGAGSPLSGRMVLYHALSGTFKVVKMRGRQDKCEVCGLPEHRTIHAIDRSSHRPEYGAIGGCNVPKYNLIGSNDRASARSAFNELKNPRAGSFLIDVRPPVQHAMAAPPGAINIPLNELKACTSADATMELVVSRLRSKRPRDEVPSEGGDAEAEDVAYIICRRGVSSVEATALLKNAFYAETADSATTKRLRGLRFVNIDGGLGRYRAEVDPAFPAY